MILFFGMRSHLLLHERCICILWDVLADLSHPVRTHHQSGRLMVGWLGRKKLVCIGVELGCKFARQKLTDNVIVGLPASGQPFCCWSAETAHSRRGTNPAGHRWHAAILARAANITPPSNKGQWVTCYLHYCADNYVTLELKVKLPRTLLKENDKTNKTNKAGWCLFWIQRVYLQLSSLPHCVCRVNSYR